MPQFADGGPRRTKLKPVRFAPAELERLEAFLAGREFSAVVRAYVLGEPAPEPKPPRPIIVRRRLSEFEAAQVRHMAWLGNNLNQIARAANQGSSGPAILAALVSLERELRAFTKQTEDTRHQLRPTAARKRPATHVR